MVARCISGGARVRYKLSPVGNCRNSGKGARLFFTPKRFGGRWLTDGLSARCTLSTAPDGAGPTPITPSGCESARGAHTCRAGARQGLRTRQWAPARLCAQQRIVLRQHSHSANSLAAAAAPAGRPNRGEPSALPGELLIAESLQARDAIACDMKEEKG